MKRTSLSGPRFSRASGICIVVASSLLVLFWACGQLGLSFNNQPWKPDWMTSNWLIALGSAFVFLYFIRRDDIPKTWSHQLDQELAKHRPINLEAYKKLQEVTTNTGHIEEYAVLNWMAAEQDAIAARSGGHRQAQSEFLNRKL